MKRTKWPLFTTLTVLMIFVAACATSIPTPTPPPPSTVSTKLDVSYGAAPAAGWKWGVAEITTGAEERIENTANHGFAWIFYVVRGSTEIGTADGKMVIPAGEAAILPARQEHTHRFLPQSQVLVFRPADRPFGEFHRGNRLFESGAALPLTAGQDYKVRIREHTLSPGAASITVDANFGYVLEGTLTVRAGDSVTTQQAGTAFGLPSNVRQVLSNGGTTPVRFILTDLH
ncbi:MAG: cupin domain-containing protein [Chloroflexi bacterium]|nr:cupin domain-containing protein [Chloroflexota bacterium]